MDQGVRIRPVLLLLLGAKWSPGGQGHRHRGVGEVHVGVVLEPVHQHHPERGAASAGLPQFIPDTTVSSALQS